MLSEKIALEYKTVRKGVGWHRLTSEAAFEMSGKDSISFLHGMVSNDVKSLKEGFGCYAACLTATGKVLSDLRIYRMSDRLLVLLPQEAKKKILEHFDKFIFIEEVFFKDPDKEITLLSVQGPKSQKLLSDLVGRTLSLAVYQHAPFEVEGISLEVIGATHTGEEGFDLLVPLKDSSRFCNILQGKGRSYGLLEIAEETLEILRIEAALPRYGMDMDESTILLEAGLEGAVSFTKGCYLGQEVIAKIKNIGHVNRQLVGLKLSAPASRGDGVHDNEKEVGFVTSACYSPTRDSYVALAMLRREAALSEAPVLVKTGKEALRAVIVPLPFYART